MMLVVSSNVLSTKFSTMMGVQYPFMNAPMGGTAYCAMAKGVSQAGGFGLIGYGYAVNETVVKTELQTCNAAKGPDGKKLRFGVGFITYYLDQVPNSFNDALAAKPVAMFFSFGNASKYAARAHANGIKVISQIESVDGGYITFAVRNKTVYLIVAAVVAADYSDVIVAQGQEAGGHGATGISTWPLVVQVIQKFKDLNKDIPIIAAGGLGDENGLLRALYLVYLNSTKVGSVLFAHLLF
ncbi:unnamed protein product [Didymodactylos carnosus]|uniref:Nitronate monooxygenase domain-containing protein n=1 Tax=Didymodactylos carnosus TaxID=1234261 RepID=A0A816BRY1_9BILA|nr:unnamed protein product [Didymodactylos carnosus]CAF1614064.1 unnamed protein product [Didymodactylos carnosus]CAF3737183.1 unnamed protein product [Didymodactylos carnosus]CAF4499341.1 unnamed protein product [Didymodactylos carnosus]